MGEAEFQGILWAEQPLLSSLMKSLLWCLYVRSLGRGRAQQGPVDTASTSLQSESCLSPHSNNVSSSQPSFRQCLPISPWCPHVCSQIGTGAQSEHVHHYKNPLVDVALLRSVYSCRCRSLHLTQSLETSSPTSSPCPTFCHCRVISWISPYLYGLFIYISGNFSLLLAPCFHHNFDLVTRRMNRASTIYAIFFPLPA